MPGDLFIFDATPQFNVSLEQTFIKAGYRVTVVYDKTFQN